MIYRLLGELQIGRDERLLRLPGGPTLLLLAALLLGVNRKMSKTELIRAAWGTDQMSDTQLYKRVKEVRGLLAKIGRDDDLFNHHGFGYELQAADDEIDTLQFARLVRQAHRAGMQDDAEGEIALLRQALGLWRSARPLSNVPSDAFHRELAQLEQRRRRAAARLFELELSRGEHERIVDELIRLTGVYPDDQRLCEQLMIAQYRSGRPADVARAYERHVEGLAAETGGVPDQLLRAFHFAVARGDRDAASLAELDIVRRRNMPTHAVTYLPRQLPPAFELVGRDAVIAELKSILRTWPDRGPVIVISGPGGIGKTGLALYVANVLASQYPDGQLYAELRGADGTVTDTAEVLAQFLRALGVPRIPAAKAERLSTYRTLLARRRLLVVLDDAASGDQIADLMPNSAGCSVLVTSRERLPDLSGARHVAPLEPLSPEDGTTLFLSVVRAAGVILPSLDHVDEVVALCGGLPLALRIAGSLRVHDHPRSTAALARRLADQGPEAFAHGQQSVARTIGAGFERLDAPARHLFLGLGLLPLRGFGLWTAAALLDSIGADPVSALSQLAARFMITSAQTRPRYGFHDLTWAYARRRAEAEWTEPVRDIHDHVYQALLTLTRRAHARLYGADFDVVHSELPDWDAPAEVLAEVDADPLDWFETERESIRAAVEHSAALGLTSVCWDLAVSAHEFYTIRGYHDDWQVTHAAALEACRAAGDRHGEALVLTSRNQPALLASLHADEAASVAELELAVRLLTESGDQHGYAVALRTLANALRRRGYLHRPLELFQEALVAFDTSGDRTGWWQAQRFLGQTYLDMGRPVDARRALAEAEAVAGEAGWSRLLAQTRYWIGQASLADPADLAAAQAAFEAVLDVFGEDGGVGRAYALHGLGDLALLRGTAKVAEQHLSRAAELARDGADAALEGRVRLSLARLHAAQGRPEAQVEMLTEAIVVFAQGGLAYLEVRALAALAQMQAARGEGKAAAAAWERMESLSEVLPDEDRRYRRPDC
jgi:DNA-binding SARP family transcriptional activator/tetratricopeptide (TPR) repeat protein